MVMNMLLGVIGAREFDIYCIMLITFLAVLCGSKLLDISLWIKVEFDVYSTMFKVTQGNTFLCGS